MMRLEQMILLEQTIVGLLLTTFFVSGRLVEDVRLAGGGRWGEGRVEVRMGGEWGTVCDDEWDHQDARVVCRMLGQSGGIAYSKAYFGQGEGRIVLDSVGCTGDEDHLNMCMVGLPDMTSSHTCTHAEDAGVRCGLEAPASGASMSVSPLRMSPLSGNCAKGSAKSNIRLVGTGRYPRSGLVQVRDLSQGITEFGFVCDDHWSLLNARVVCSQLCFDPADALPGWRKPRSLQVPYGARIVLDDVRCSGLEASLLDCQHRPWNLHDCSASELAAVTCSTVAASLRVPQAEVQCLEDRMVVRFERRHNPALRRDSLRPPQGPHGTCSPQVWADGDSIRVALSYQLCATLTQGPGLTGNLSFQSSILVSMPAALSPGTGMKRVTEYKVRAECRVAGRYSASRRLPDVGQPVLPASGQTSLQVTMLMYRDHTFTTPVSTADAVLAPGGWINLGLALNTNQRIRLVVTSCYAGPDLSDPTKPKQALLLDKCVQEDTVSTYTLNDTFWGLRFQPFSFINFTDLTIDCEAYACKVDQASCDRSCNSATNKLNVKPSRRRMRRHVHRQPRDPHIDHVIVPSDPTSELIQIEKKQYKADTVQTLWEQNNTLPQTQLAPYLDTKDAWAPERKYAQLFQSKNQAKHRSEEINIETTKAMNAVLPQVQDAELLKANDGNVWGTMNGETEGNKLDKRYGTHLETDSDEVPHLKIKARTSSRHGVINILSATPRNSPSSNKDIKQLSANLLKHAKSQPQRWRGEHKQPKPQSGRDLKNRPETKLVNKNKLGQSKLKTEGMKITRNQSHSEMWKQARQIPKKNKLTQSGLMTENDQSGDKKRNNGDTIFRTADKLSQSERGSRRKATYQSYGVKKGKGRVNDQSQGVKEGQGRVYDQSQGVKEGQGRVNDQSQGVKEGQRRVNDQSEGVKEGQGRVNDQSEGVKEGKGRVNDQSQGVKEGQRRVNDQSQGEKEGQRRVNDQSEGVKEGQGRVNDQSQGMKEGKGRVNDQSEGVKEGQGRVNDQSEGVKVGQGRVKDQSQGVKEGQGRVNDQSQGGKGGQGRRNGSVLGYRLSARLTVSLVKSD